MRLRALYLYLFLLAACFAHAANDYVFRVINASSDLADNSVQVIVCTKTGRMIISTIGNINFYDGATFSHIDTYQKYQYHLPEYKGNDHIYFDRRHHMWLKSKGNVSCVDLLTEQFVVNVDSVLREMGARQHLNDLFVDSVGHVWMLTDKGLYGVEQNMTYPLPSKRNLQDVDVYDDKMLLTFFEDGEQVAQDIRTGRVIFRTRAYSEGEKEKYNSSSLIYRYRNGYFQIRNGKELSVLNYFDVDKRSWRKVLEYPSHLNSMVMKDSMLYIACTSGYWRYHVVSNELVHFKMLKLQDGSEIESNCNTLTFDRQGGLWIGTERRGLFYARPMCSPFHIYTWDNPMAMHYANMMADIEDKTFEFRGLQANCEYHDSRGWTWIGTTRGVYLYRSSDAKPQVFTKISGLHNNVVHSVIEDASHNIWLSTSSGITCILFEGNEPVFVNSYSESDNVPSESFFNSKSMLLDDGSIVMQALDHVIKFHPDSFAFSNVRRPMQFYPKLVHLLVNGNIVEPNEEVEGNIVIDRAITRVTDISLNSDQRSITLTFSALNYYRPLQSYYRVRVKGLPNADEWQVFAYNDRSGYVDKSGMLHLPLVGLLPGDYEVEVQASMFPDIWDGTPFVWKVHVNQPLWRTRSVQLFLGLILLALAVFNFVLYNRNTRMRVRRANEEGDVIRRLNSFVERCDITSSEILKPTEEELTGSAQDERTKLSPEFIALMLKLVPYVKKHDVRSLTMHNLSEMCGVDVVRFYEIVSNELYKNPRELSRIFSLRRAAELLEQTDDSVAKIARQCGFYTPNYFMGSFFHEYKMTPEEYRKQYRG